MEDVSYKGKKAVRVIASDADETMAILKDKIFENGVIELDVAGTTMSTASTTARGFIGLAFRVRMADSVRYECFYIRPTNGRAEDQLRRNHSTQYISHPKYTWFKLRNENPSVYESYADLMPGEWTHIKIEVNETKAKLYVNGASQPCLIVQDLKYGISSGSIALWVGPGTDGYFANLKIQSSK
jgi:Concanavalin A-like lectin/glucanases superfamily